MSYILDALRKAERERRLGGIPGIELSSQSAAAGRGTRWPQWLALGLLVNALLVAGAIMLWQQQRSSATDAPPAAPTNAPELLDTDDLPASIELPAPAVQEQRPFADGVGEGDSLGGKASPGQAAPAAPAPRATPAPRALPPPPLLSELPQRYRNSVPDLALTVHVYSDVPSQRFVFINDRRYREGQQLKEGPQLESIQPRGVILSFNGERFLLVGDW